MEMFSTSSPERLTLGKKITNTNCIGCWIGPRARMDIFGKRKPHFESKHIQQNKEEIFSEM